ncbi:MAG: bis(5'-nucleosyl)-tetraphosphatase (symmetrical) YqeK [Firmicutes bacterium]|nr:bis(5'-nucleosyl)-tetraphosphatase (symmetrical) YqeK [Bacillota bacterium]
MKSLEELYRLVFNKLQKDQKRQIHTEGVISTAISLCGVYGIDPIKGEIAGLLHDSTKLESKEETISRIIHFFGKEELNLWPPKAWHALSACDYAKHECEIDDEDILNAICFHTTGRSDMSILEKIIYVSDFIEDSRKNVNEKLKNLSKINLDKTVFEIMKLTISHLTRNGEFIAKITKEAIDNYQMKLEEMNE